MPKRSGRKISNGLVTLPTLEVNINGYLVRDALADTGCQVSLIDSRVFSIIAPNVPLISSENLLSASGDSMNALGACSLTVETTDTDKPVCEQRFIVVHNLLHDVILGWDFLSQNNYVLNCSSKRNARIKLRAKKAVTVPPGTATCLTVKVDQPLSCDEEYLFVGQRSNNLEICDSLVKPFGSHEIPVYIRNRSEHLITIHRRSVIGYAETVGKLDEKSGNSCASGNVPTAAVNAVSSDDGRFVGKTAEEVLSEFVVGDAISGAQRDKLAALLQAFPEAFSRGYSDIGKYNGGKVDLELADGARPTFVKPYPIPWAREDQLRSQLEELQGCGVIEKGGPSDWNSPIVLVPKSKSGPKEYRIVQDMRSLNKLLVPKHFAFPTIDEFVFSLDGWKVASSLDIRHAFWNLELSEESSKMCAFYALGSTYWPTRLPMGCVQSSYWLHLVMHKVLGDLEGVKVYSDDILLVSKSVNEHFQLLHTVLDRLRAAGLKVAPDKCRLFQTSLTYLGHYITPDGICMDPERVKIIADMQPPSSLKEAKRIFGFFSWFRKFLPRFSEISEPLAELCNAEKFYWNSELDECFSALKDAVMSGEVLSYPRRGCPFLLYTDSSTAASGQILTQIIDGQERVIAYNGARYNKAQRKWTIFELEVYSFLQGLKKFFRFLADATFTWVCDCKSALQILNNKDQINPRLIRWRAFVSQFRFEVEHRNARDMQHVDMLSRIHDTELSEFDPASVNVSPISPRSPQALGEPSARANVEPPAPTPALPAPERPLPSPGEAVQELQNSDPAVEPPAVAGSLTHHGASAQSDADPHPGQEQSRSDSGGPPLEKGAREVNSVAADSLVQYPLKPESLVWYQRHDRNCRSIAYHLKHGKWPQYTPPYLKRFPISDFLLKDGILMKREESLKVVWPIAKRFEIIFHHHDVSHHAHGGSERLYEQLQRSVWYPGLRRDCDDYVRSCDKCGRRKSVRVQNAPLLPQKACFPNETLVIDVFSLPRSATSGRSQVLTCVDKFTGFLVCYPLDSTTADHIIEKLTVHFLTFGPPTCIESDAGSNLLKNSRVQTMCKYFGVQFRFSVGYHHEAVAKAERKHLDIKRRLRALSESNGSDWEQCLPGIVFSLNNEICATHGYTPFFIYFLRHPHTPLSELANNDVSKYSDQYVCEKLRLLSATMRNALQKQGLQMGQYKKRYDARHKCKDKYLKSGDQVWCQNFNARSKLDDPWVGPYTVVTLVGRRHVDCIDSRGAIRRVHINHLKPVCARSV